MSDSRIYTAALIVIGDEILSGRTHDKNIMSMINYFVCICHSLSASKCYFEEGDNRRDPKK